MCDELPHEMTLEEEMAFKTPFTRWLHKSKHIVPDLSVNVSSAFM